MACEDAAAICTSIAQEVRALRLSGGQPSAKVNEMIEKLWLAPAENPLDVLALAALSRKLLASSIGAVTADDLADIDSPRGISLFALVFLHRVVESLEALTGFSAEGFTGEAYAVN